MSATAFDTHKVAKTLAKAGFTEPQVEAQVDVLSEIADELATKRDLQDLKNELIIKMGSICAGSVFIAAAIVTAIVKLL